MNAEMEITRVQAVLGELLEAEERSLLPRLLESTVFADSQAAGELGIVRHMVAEHQEDARRLFETLVALDGRPGPSVSEIGSADFHYLDLEVLLPRVLADQEQLAARYGAAAEALDDCPPAADVVGEIAGRHRTRAEYLRKLAESAAAGT